MGSSSRRSVVWAGESCLQERIRLRREQLLAVLQKLSRKVLSCSLGAVASSSDTEVVASGELLRSPLGVGFGADRVGNRYLDTVRTDGNGDPI